MKNQKMYEADDKMISLIRDNYDLLQSLGSFGISLGFGDKTVKETCEDNDVDTYTFLAVVNYTINGYGEFESDEQISVPTLLHYLEASHAYFLDFQLPYIRRELAESLNEDDSLARLIMRFYDVTEGSICVDGTDIRDYTQESLRRNIGIVQQDVFLFAGSVLENIRYGRLDATDEEVVQAAIRAHIHEEIMAFPDQYHTEVGERGVKLSGGQKQRISIARLFLKNPRILILDEATSALDTVTEYDIQKSFDELTVGRTTLIIAHRLSTVRNANEIIVIDEQGIRERGSHEELLQQNGLYANFYQATLTD